MADDNNENKLRNDLKESMSKSTHEFDRDRLCSDVPDDYGLLITFEEGGTCLMEYTPDSHLPDIHPNAYGPACLSDLSTLGGGGSGVRVFKGHHPRLGSLVMKHGGYTDTKDLFALVKISRELERRNSPIAAAEMKSRLPEFRMIYISPRHLSERPRGLWSRLMKLTKEFSTEHSSSSEKLSLDDIAIPKNGVEGDVSPEGVSSIYSSNARSIRIFSSKKEEVKVCPLSHSVDMILGSGDDITSVNGSLLQYGATGNGYDNLKIFVAALADTQEKWFWKFTLAQKTIGGASPRTASSFLGEGELSGDLLETLIRDFLLVIHNLQLLTLPEEENVVDQVRTELRGIEQDVFSQPADVSKVADAFVGFAIRKNWHPEKGRFVRLQRMGNEFRSDLLHLELEERIPCRHLGILLKAASCMSASFEGSSPTPTALETKGCRLDTWRVLLKDATNLKCKAALNRVFNSGLADAGIHNMFLSSDHIWLFDLGEPTLQPLPAFLTKFLFSFFHTLGMVDDKVNGGWVNRFIPGEKLALTEETKRLLPKACDAFKVTLDRLVDVLFEGEEAVRGLLINYVTIQLLSDASFCLERWTIKGGGHTRASNHHKSIVEWPWRALWDIYVASHINTSESLRYFGAISSDENIYGA